MSYTLPPVAMKYMLKYGLTDEEILLSRFGWSRSLARMIMPVYSSEDELLYWQGRNLGQITDDRPKYKNIYLNEARDIFAKFHRRQKGSVLWGKEDIVIVEAIISAVKLSRHVDTIALLGSSIPATIISRLRDYRRIHIWLDPDKIQASIIQTMRLSQLLAGKVVNVMSSKKPKECSDKEILWHLN